MTRMIAWGVMAMVVLAIAAPMAGAELLAGAAKVAITPKDPAYLAGYDSNRLSTRVQSDIWARALVLKSGDKTLTLVTLDLLGWPYARLAKLRQMVKSVPADTLLVASTHSHSAPDPIGLWGPEPTKSGVNQAWMEETYTKIVAAIDQAAKSLQPARLRLGAVETKGIATNIRVPRINDAELRVLQLVDAQGKAIATVANLACHAEIMQNDLLSADFPGYYYQQIEQDLGGVAMFVNGAQGGMVTADIPGLYQKEGQDNSADAQKIGLAVATETKRALEGAATLDNPSLSYRFVDLLLPLDNERYRAGMSAGLLPNVLEEGKVHTQVAVIALGPAQIVTAPGELLPNLGLRLKRMMTGQPRFVFGLTQDELGYILSEDDWGLDIYKYESNTGPGPKTWPLLLSTLLPVLAEVKPAAAAPAAPAAGQGGVAAWFGGLTAKFKPEAAEGMNAVYCFKITGDGGGDWTVAIADRKCAVAPKAAEKADLTVTISAQDWLDLLAGKLDPMAALAAGKLVLDGDMGLATKIPELFLN